MVFFFRRRSKDIPQKYIKAVYREYTDSTYTVPKPRPAWTGRSLLLIFSIFLINQIFHTVCVILSHFLLMVNTTVCLMFNVQGQCNQYFGKQTKIRSKRMARISNVKYIFSCFTIETENREQVQCLGRLQCWSDFSIQITTTYL